MRKLSCTKISSETECQGNVVKNHICQNLRLTNSFLNPQDGALMAIILTVGTLSLLENAVANVINKVYNIFDGAEIDSILLEDYLGN